ncbi:MAG: hypothetical protein KDA41_08685 [Planctomycetales bacterium]|nr:hypothetical protein [Planctomycetales bacterium]
MTRLLFAHGVPHQRGTPELGKQRLHRKACTMERELTDRVEGIQERITQLRDSL